MTDGSGEALAPREDFPALADSTYLNAASIALTPLPVRRAVQRFEEEVGGRGTVGFDDAAEARAYEAPRAAAAGLLGAEPADIAITTSATEALGQVAWWLRPGAGQNVVSIDIEFPSVTYPWFRIAEETGLETRLVQARHDPAGLSIDDVAALVDDRTAVLCVSHVQYATGRTLDLADLAALSHAHGAILVVDATQSAGMMPIDVRTTEVDVLVAGAYKWLCSAFGAAICYLSPQLAPRFRPPFVGWRSKVNPFELDATTMPIAPGARGMEYSTVAYGSGVALGAAIDYLMAFGIDRILAHDLSLAARLADGLVALGATLISPTNERGGTAIVAARFPGLDHARMWGSLTAEGVYTSHRLDAIRFSPHLYNDARDIDRALGVVEGVVGRARRT